MGSTTLHFTEKAVVSGSLLDLPTKPVRHGGNSERETRRKSRIKYQAGVLLSAQVSLPNSLDSMGWVCDGSHSLLAICRPTKQIHVCTVYSQCMYCFFSDVQVPRLRIQGEPRHILVPKL